MVDVKALDVKALEGLDLRELERIMREFAKVLVEKRQAESRRLAESADRIRNAILQELSVWGEDFRVVAVIRGGRIEKFNVARVGLLSPQENGATPRSIPVVVDGREYPSVRAALRECGYEGAPLNARQGVEWLRRQGHTVTLRR